MTPKFYSDRLEATLPAFHESDGSDFDLWVLSITEDFEKRTKSKLCRTRPWIEGPVRGYWH